MSLCDTTLHSNEETIATCNNICPSNRRKPSNTRSQEQLDTTGLHFYRAPLDATTAVDIYIGENVPSCILNMVYFACHTSIRT